VIYCWGDNRFGELGDGTTTGSAMAVSGNSIALDVSAGAHYTCSWPNFVPSYCWGSNDAGQLGNGTTNDSATPVAVQGGLPFTSGSAGAEHACGVTSAGVAYCWGDNSSGQLGNGTTTRSSTPTAVAGRLTFAARSPDNAAFLFATVSAGGRHTCGITSNQLGGLPAPGAVYCWGDNTYGQLGNAWTTTSNVPVNVAGVP
jgi:alpha-tubulin suppressor-like RCC1 family protein